ncbi:MAG: YbbR-like domain-containing protein [Acidobacteriaceae bacterium]|nr:YbbR-like domain-containing protein [Acidobacteriaceae bacterium]
MSRPVYNFLHRTLLHNLGLKLFSLALAAGLWLALAEQPDSEVAMDVPIALVNMPPNLEVSSETVPKAQVRLRGPASLIRRLQPGDAFAEIELNGVKPGERTFDLKVHHPRDLTLVQVIPSSVRIAFDLHSSRAIPVKPQVTGNLTRGYRVAGLQVEPSSIEVSGPKQRVDELDAASTDPVDLSETTSQKFFMRHAYVSDPLVQVTTSDPVKIIVTMEKTSANEH